MNLTSFTWSSASSSGLKVSPETLAHIGRIWARPPGGGSETTWTREAWSALGGVIEITIAAGSGWDRGPRRGRVFRWSVQEDPNLAPRLNYGHSLLSWTNGCFKVQRRAEVSPAPSKRDRTTRVFVRQKLGSNGHQPFWTWELLHGYWVVWRATSLLHSTEIKSFLSINDTTLCEDTDHINKFSIIIITDSKWLFKIGYCTQLNELCYI